VDTTSAFLSKTFDVGDLPLPTFGNCVLKTGVIKWPLRQYVRFYVFFLKIQKPDFTLFELLHALFRTLDMLAFAAAAPSVQQSIDISYRPGPQQQTRRTLLRRSITGADTVTADGRTPYRYTDPAACYMRAGSGVLGGIRGYTAYTNIWGFFDSVYSPRQRS